MISNAAYFAQISCDIFSGRSKGGVRDAPPPPVQILSISCSFLGKFGKIARWRPLPHGGLAPPHRGNPGSATDLVVIICRHIFFVTDVW